MRYEQERKVTYITTAERIGFEKGVQQGIEQGIQQGLRQGLLKAVELGLELKFGSEGLRLYPEIRRIEDPDILAAIGEGIKVAQTLAEVERIYSLSRFTFRVLHHNRASAIKFLKDCFLILSSQAV